MRRVVVESPYGTRPDGTRASPEEVERNVRYVRAAMHDCLKRGEAPFASHALYVLPGVLDDDIPHQRKTGMEAGFAWQSRAEAAVVYCDLGITLGMGEGIARARALPSVLGPPIPVEFRSLGAPWLDFEHQAAISLIARRPRTVTRLEPQILCVWNRRYECWTMPGGLVEPDESVEDAQERELREETGLETRERLPVFRGPHGAPVKPGRASVINIFDVEPIEDRSFHSWTVEAGCPVEWKTVDAFLEGSTFKPLYEHILPALVDASIYRQEKQGR